MLSCTIASWQHFLLDKFSTSGNAITKICVQEVLSMKRHTAVLTATIIVFCLMSVTAFASPSDNTAGKSQAKSMLLMENSSGKIIFEEKPHEKLSLASVTKIMTMLLTMEAVDSGQIKLSDRVTCSARVKSMGGSTMCLEEGEVRTVEELLKGVAVESANDAAVALAEYVAGSEEAFVAKMNSRAKALGMNDTHFVNCMGFYSPEHYTSAYDVAIMSRELLKHSAILNYTSIWMETISEGRKSPFTIVNRNKMVRYFKGCDGLKTGFVKEAMYCISATAKRGDIRFIAVIMGAPTIKDRTEAAGKLLNMGFARYDSRLLVKKGESVQEISISKAKPERISAVASGDFSAVIEKGAKDNFIKKFEMSSNKPPLKKGDVVGMLRIYQNGKEIGSVKCLTDRDVYNLNFFDMLNKNIDEMLGIKNVP